MNIALWIVQGLLALAFCAAGFMKGFSPTAELAANMPWINDVPSWVPRLAGIAELLGGLGLILPSVLRIQPRLTVMAAWGLVAVMVLAAIFHISRGEYDALLPNIILGGLAGFVAYGRSKLHPIVAKG